MPLGGERATVWGTYSRAFAGVVPWSSTAQDGQFFKADTVYETYFYVVTL